MSSRVNATGDQLIRFNGHRALPPQSFLYKYIRPPFLSCVVCPLSTYLSVQSYAQHFRCLLKTSCFYLKTVAHDEKYVGAMYTANDKGEITREEGNSNL